MATAQRAHAHNDPKISMPRLLSIKQVMHELGIGRTSVYELINVGTLKTVKIRRRRLVTAEAIDEFIAGLSK